MPDELKPGPYDGPASPSPRSDDRVGAGAQRGEPKPPPPHPKHDLPPHILKEIMDLKEKVGKLEGMMEVLMKIVVQPK